MRNIRFEKAGRIENLDRQVFLTSHDRRKKAGTTIFHRNDYNTTILVPDDVFKKHFRYNRFSGVYDTGLTWREILTAGAFIKSEWIEIYGEKREDIIYIP